MTDYPDKDALDIQCDMPRRRRAHAASARRRDGDVSALHRLGGGGSGGAPPASGDADLIDVTGHARDMLERTHGQSKRLRQAIAMIDKVPHGHALLRLADRAGVSIISDLDEHVLGYYAPRTNPKIVGITDTQGVPEQVASLGHELFHAWQDFGGDWITANLSPEDELLVQRILEAGAEASAVHLCHQLKEAGFAEPWDHYIRQNRRGFDYSDIAEAYDTRRRRARGNESNKALRAAFDQWFAIPERRAAYDSKIVWLMERYQYAFIEAAKCPIQKPDSAWLSRLGVMPDGNNFLAGTGKLSLAHGWYRAGMDSELANRFDHANSMISAPDGESEGIENTGYESDDDAPLTMRDFMVFPASKASPPAGPAPDLSTAPQRPPPGPSP